MPPVTARIWSWTVPAFAPFDIDPPDDAIHPSPLNKFPTVPAALNAVNISAVAFVVADVVEMKDRTIIFVGEDGPVN